MGRTITAALGTAGVEEVQDTVATMMANGGGLTWTYNDPANTLTPAIAHSGISGLTADDHAQYVLLLGRATGQIVYGGTAASDPLTLHTTSNATKGVFSVDTNHIYKDASGNVGIGGTPVAKFHVFGGAVSGAGIQISGSSSPKLRVAETGSSVFADLQSDGGAGYVGTNSNHPFVINSASAEAARFDISRNFGIGTGATVDRRLHIEQDSAATNTVTQVARFTSASTGTPANGIGVGMEFEVETAAATNKVGATIEAVATDVTGASEDFDLVFKTMAAGATAAEAGRFTSTKQLVTNGATAPAFGAFPHIQVSNRGMLYAAAGLNDSMSVAYNTYIDSAGNAAHLITQGACRTIYGVSGTDIYMQSAVSAAAGAAASFSTHSIFYGGGGLVVGAPTGGNKGAGTINAVAVYDDNVLLTCYVLDQALDGTISIPKWDAKVPARTHVDVDGKVLSVESRVHEPVRKFAARIGTMYDPLDLDKFWKHVVDKRHLTAYPNEEKYDPVNGKQDVGNWQQQTIELLEIYAVHIHKLNDRIKALELKP